MRDASVNWPQASVLGPSIVGQLIEIVSACGGSHFCRLGCHVPFSVLVVEGCYRDCIYGSEWTIVGRGSEQKA